jgi:hypothetical protein
LRHPKHGLGRLGDAERIREVATAICEHKVKVKDAVLMIRTWRIGRTSPGDPDAPPSACVT